MAVAKSYQSATILTEPYEKNKRKYVLIKTKTGLEKEVRWYTDAEYARMYPEEKKKINQRQILGFGDKGFIYLYEGDTKWLEKSIARYCRWWGWYSPFYLKVPKEMKVYKLEWSAVGGEDDRLKSEEEVRQGVRRKQIVEKRFMYEDISNMDSSTNIV